MEVYGSMGADNDKIRGMQIKSLIDERNEKIKGNDVIHYEKNS